MKSLKDIIGSKNILTVKTGTNIYDATCFMAKHNIGLSPVVAEDGKLLGVFSERDLVRRVIAKGLDLKQTSVDEVMTKDLLVADINESHDQCLKKMKDKGTRHILIVDKEKLAGILSIKDLLEVDLKDHKETIEVLQNYIYAR
ncbi:MAG: CBS domain-containing protein [Ignavibacteriales bacterium]|nr:CBS domain-containing protein [Ignavibacteriales bacterium]